MPHLRLHLVYLAVIGFLTYYHYWTKTQALNEAITSIEQFDKLMKQDSKAVNRASTIVLNYIGTNVKAMNNTINQQFLAKARTAVGAVWHLNDWFEQQKRTLTQLSGGLDRQDTHHLSNRFDVLSSATFFTDAKIQQFRDSLNRLSTLLSDISDTNTYRRYKNDIYTLHKLAEDDAYWQSLKHKTATEAVAQLTSIQNRLELDVIPYLNYIFGQVSFCGKHNDFKLVISPQNAGIVEGETYKADFYIAENRAYQNYEVATIVANNREVPIIGGVAHFEETHLAAGDKLIHATANVRHLLTGQTIAADVKFDYKVLPKCSRDCK
jgi:hypothetical protein